VINGEYSRAIGELAEEAASHPRQTGEVFFRTLQLVTHLRGPGNKRLKLRLEQGERSRFALVAESVPEYRRCHSGGTTCSPAARRHWLGRFGSCLRCS
jgi:hypothetical protein